MANSQLKFIFIFAFCLLSTFAKVLSPLASADNSPKSMDEGGLISNSYASDDLGEELKLYVGEVKVFSVNNPSRIVIGNPEVVDVTSVTKAEITLIPKAQGTTILVFWDIFGEQSYRVKVFAEDIQEVKRRIDNLLARLDLAEVKTRAEEDEGKVILLGKIKTTQEKDRINTALGPLKEKTIDLIEVKEEEAVVEIDVQVLEINKDSTSTLGFSWPGAINMTEIRPPGLAAAGGTTWGRLFNVFSVSRPAFTLAIDALVQEGKARILSRPRLACQSGKEAELMVGGEKPTFTTSVSAEGTSSAVEYKEYGIKLKIKPTVNKGERIKLALNVEVSEVGTVETIGSATATTASAYPLTKRSASTELFLDNGQTMAIGGLMRQKSEEDVRKIPGLGDVPFLGAIFRKKTTTVGGGEGERGNTELFITITPTIVSEGKIEPPRLKKQVKAEVISLAAYDNLPSSVAGYSRIVQNRILEKLFYPNSAKTAGFQGTVKLSLHLSYRGELLDAAVRDSSGYKILDEHALAAAKGTTSYPPFPASIEQKELWIDVPIAYKLD